MKSFDRLHPAVQHHIVNTLGWSALRPLQEAAVEPLLAGEHALLVAPTAGGKTEAAVFPLFSRMVAEGWRGPSVLYVCPLRALLNNLEPRLARYAELLGRRVALWHGDVRPAARRRIVSDPPDVLLTTPESLEAMLTLRRSERATLFGQVRAAVVDELHAFAGDDRGWHLLAVLARVERAAGREVQRVGLSATVGNPDDLLGWFTDGHPGPRRVVAPPADAGPVPDVELDFVGNLKNAAVVISRLHRGEKRLVFVDSRSRVERLAAELGALDVRTYVSHSSLSVDARRQTERAFAEARDCVIVATSTLELGLDVGDLDRVIQIDAPGTVASFLQRLGRTGRRPGSARNCLILATDDDALLRAAALLDRWTAGYVEPVVAPPDPLHILAQQVLALVLEGGGIGRTSLRERFDPDSALGRLATDHLDAIVSHLLASGVLFDDQGILGFGPQGERRFGRRNFLDLCSVFTADPLFCVLHGRDEIGWVHEASFVVKRDRPPVLLLGGRAWAVRHVDWRRRTAWVEPTDERGQSRWMGSSRPVHFVLAQAVRRVLHTGTVPGRLSRRATERLEEVRAEMSWVEEGTTAIVRDAGGTTRWWTFAGLLANQTIAHHLPEFCDTDVPCGNLWIPIRGDADTDGLRRVVSDTPAEAAASWVPPVGEKAIDGLKFSSCLPRPLAEAVVARRSVAPEAVRLVMTGPVGNVTDGGVA